MNIEEIHKDKKEIIKKAVVRAYNSIAKAIEKDKNYSLSDLEMPELVWELLEREIANY